jgi:hypothetical protein
LEFSRIIEKSPGNQPSADAGGAQEWAFRRIGKGGIRSPLRIFCVVAVLASGFPLTLL